MGGGSSVSTLPGATGAELDTRWGGRLRRHTSRQDDVRYDTPVFGGATTITTFSIPQQAYPTAAQEKEGERDAANKAKGIEKVAKRTPKVMERHVDGCGDNLQGLKDVGCPCCVVESSSSDEVTALTMMHNGTTYAVHTGLNHY